MDEALGTRVKACCAGCPHSQHAGHDAALEVEIEITETVIVEVEFAA